MQPFLRYALRGLTKRPGRSLFIIFMMAVGVMLIAGTSIALKSIPSMLEAPVEEANMADFSLTLKMAPREVVENICRGDEAVKEFEVRLIFRSTAYAEKGWPKTTDILLLGVEAPLRLNRIILVDGRLFEGDEEAVVVEHDYGVNLLGRAILVETPKGNVTLKVVGTCRAVWIPRWAVSSTAYALIPLEVLQSVLGVEEAVNNVLVKVEENHKPEDVMTDLSDRLGLYGVVSRSLEGRVTPFVETQSYYNYLVSLLSLIGFSLLAVSLALMYGSLSLMVTQEFRDLGTLKALGATRGGLLLAYSLRSLLLGLVGSSLGSFLGVLAARLILTGLASTSLTFEGITYTAHSIFQIAQENLDALILYSTLGAGLSMFLVLPPAISASRVPAAQAVGTFPGLSIAETGARSKVGLGPLFARYAFRSLGRRKGREIVVVLIIVISVAMNSALIAASESQQGILNEVDEAMNFDFFVCLSGRVSSTLLEERLEAYEEDLAFWGFAYYTYAKAAGYTLLIIGMPQETPYFSYRMIDGRWFTEGENETVLSENLANMLGVWVGDNLRLSNERTSIDVTVVGIRKDPVFNIPMVPLSVARSLDGCEGRVNAVVLKAEEGVNVDRLIREVKKALPGYLWHIKKSGAVKIISDVLTKTFQSTAATMITFNWLTSVILIFSILGQNINEERIVFTILRALGMKKRTCILIVVFKISVLGLAAVALSALAAPLILKVFSELLAGPSSFSVSIVLPPQIYLTSAAFIMATTLPSGLILGAYITGVKLSEALRYE